MRTMPNPAVPENIKYTIPAKAGISLFTLIFRFNHPSHSCEGRNLRAEGGNCTISRRFVAAEIPPFAGMGRGWEWDGRCMRPRNSLYNRKMENDDSAMHPRLPAAVEWLRQLVAFDTTPPKSN
ncbi:MAG: hypothetical protein ACR2QC_00510, partial [Gammaproteobacteria bacterium]